MENKRLNFAFIKDGYWEANSVFDLFKVQISIVINDQDNPDNIGKFMIDFRNEEISKWIKENHKDKYTTFYANFATARSVANTLYNIVLQEMAK